MTKETPEERAARLVREMSEVREKAAVLLLPSTIGDAVIAMLEAGVELTRATLLARLQRDAEFGSGPEQRKAKAAIAFIDASPPAHQSPP